MARRFSPEHTTYFYQHEPMSLNVGNIISMDAFLHGTPAPRHVKPLPHYTVNKDAYGMNRDKNKVQFRSSTNDLFELHAVLSRVIVDSDRGFLVLYFDAEHLDAQAVGVIEALDDAISSVLLQNRLLHCYKVVRRIQPDLRGRMQLKLKFFVKDTKVKLAPGLEWPAPTGYYTPAAPMPATRLTQELTYDQLKQLFVPGSKLRCVLEVCQPWCMKNEKTCELEMGNYLRVHAVEILDQQPVQHGGALEIEGF